ERHELHVSDVQIVAHRGAHARAPENSLGSIREARELGVDMVELDVRTTSDGDLVLMHDDSVDRTTNGSGDVSELEALDAISLVLDEHEGGGSRERVPLLSEAIADVAEHGGRPRIYLHVKEAEPEAIARAVAAGAAGSVVVFHEESEWLREL